MEEGEEEEVELSEDEILEPPPTQHGEAIVAPDKWDVLCGRGKSIGHPGNQRFRQIILGRRDEYQRAMRRDDKTRITIEVVESLRRGPDPSRFLLKDPKSNLWYDVGDSYAREKISHALRSRPNQERKRQAKQRPKKSRKAQITDDQEEMVQKIIVDQQQLLRQMIEQEVFPGGTVISSLANPIG